MLGGVRDFVVVSSPDALKQLENCLGDGRRWGISFEYVAQPQHILRHRPQQIRQAMSGNPLFDANQFVKVFEDRTGLKIACPEEVAFRMGFIDRAGLNACIWPADKTRYTDYLRSIVRREDDRGA